MHIMKSNQNTHIWMKHWILIDEYLNLWFLSSKGMIKWNSLEEKFYSNSWRISKLQITQCLYYLMVLVPTPVISPEHQIEACSFSFWTPSHDACVSCSSSIEEVWLVSLWLPQLQQLPPPSLPKTWWSHLKCYLCQCRSL